MQRNTYNQFILAMAWLRNNQAVAIGKHSHQFNSNYEDYDNKEIYYNGNNSISLYNYLRRTYLNLDLPDLGIQDHVMLSPGKNLITKRSEARVYKALKSLITSGVVSKAITETADELVSMLVNSERFNKPNMLVRLYRKLTGKHQVDLINWNKDFTLYVITKQLTLNKMSVEVKVSYYPTEGFMEDLESDLNVSAVETTDNLENWIKYHLNGVIVGLLNKGFDYA